MPRRPLQVPGIYGIDTRALTKHIRDQGAMLGKIVPAGMADAQVVQVDPNTINLVQQVSLTAPQLFVSHAPPRIGRNGKRMRIVAVDCGIKANIIRYFMAKGVELLLVPWDHDFNKEEYDGLFISNGPGDPTKCQATIQHLRTALTQVCIGLYTILPSPILYGVWHKKGRSVGGRILRNGRAIVLQ